MKLAVKLTLLMFVIFLSTPTIVGMIEKSCDTSIFFSMTEEELSHKEIKAELKFSPSHEFIEISAFSSSLILSENLSKHDNVCASIFIPPPDLV
jgi:hypothetical protein